MKQLPMARICYDVLKAYDAMDEDPSKALNSIGAEEERVNKAISLLFEKGFLEVEQNAPRRLGSKRSDKLGDFSISYDGCMEMIRLKALFEPVTDKNSNDSKESEVN